MSRCGEGRDGDHSLLSALVADAAPPELRGTAFGAFNLAIGIAALLASVIAGALWDAVGPQGTFAVGAGFTLVALAGLFATRGRLPPKRDERICIGCPLGRS